MPWSRAFAVGCGLCVLVGAASMAPLVVYGGSLALFGLAHVAYEFRYVDGRFGQKLSREFLITLGVLGIAIVLSRSLFATHALPSRWQAGVEIALLVAFTLAAVPPLMKVSLWSPAPALGLAVVLSCGVWFAPAATLAAFSILHNVTPVGFLIEAAPAESRRRVGMMYMAIFFGVPLVVAAGFVEGALAGMGVGVVENGFGSMGTLRDHLAVFVPGSIEMPWARQLFTAAAVAQVLHYVATIVLFPRVATANGDCAHLLPWPHPRVFFVVVVVASAILLTGFVVSFPNARALYGVPAAFHAWIEIPLLLVGLRCIREQTGPIRQRS